VVIDARASHTSILDAQRGYVADAMRWLDGEAAAEARRC
jgi:hypothetical protein